MVLTNLKDAAHYAIIMSERVMENIYPARWVQGFWKSKIVKLTQKKICTLLQADNKRIRESYDSFRLFQQRKSETS